ncbi:MAG: TerB family tellurite resistance protein [Gemmatimonadota bacterium]|nr:MAG: TerB family tellurite resistance protein [Gemmatimonadota bacterium]
MIDLGKRFFGKRHTGDATTQPSDTGHDIRIATCALFLEMAGVDGEFSDEERHHIVSILKEQYQLSDEHAAALMDTAQQELDESIDLWHFTNLINRNYSEEERVEIVEMVWRIVYVDGRLDGHEDSLMHKLSKLLDLTHGQLIDAKLRVVDGD